jgi:hypothetical protein
MKEAEIRGIMVPGQSRLKTPSQGLELWLK